MEYVNALSQVFISVSVGFFLIFVYSHRSITLKKLARLREQIISGIYFGIAAIVMMQLVKSIFDNSLLTDGMVIIALAAVFYSWKSSLIAAFLITAAMYMDGYFSSSSVSITGPMHVIFIATAISLGTILNRQIPYKDSKKFKKHLLIFSFTLFPALLVWPLLLLSDRPEIAEFLRSYALFKIIIMPVFIFSVGKLFMQEIERHTQQEQLEKQYGIFGKGMSAEMSEKLKMKNSLRDAIENNELALHYQPQYDISNKSIVSFEALLRWNSKDLGMVPPLKFIKLAEETGLIHPIGSWVLKQGCLFAQKINQDSGRRVKVSINVSPLQLMQDDFVEQFEIIVSETGVNTHTIGLEITETALMEAFDKCLEKLLRLKQIGIAIYLDDFGTGYSSLNYLWKLPISTIKIDRSFINELSYDEKVRHLTAAIIELSRKLRLDTVAEGVETEEQLKILTGLGCNTVQGYLFSKPVPEEEALGLLSGSRKEEKAVLRVLK